MNIKRLFGVVVLGAALAACGQEMTVSVNFEDAGVIDSGTPVYFGDLEVGEVSGSSITGNLTEVELALDPELTAGLSSGSAALLSSRGGGPAIELYNYRPGEAPLQEGGELVGLNGPLELAAWRAGEALDTGRQSMEEMAESVNDYFESEEWRERKEQMNQRLQTLQEEMGRSWEETNRAYQQFLEDLEGESEAARERARESYAELSEKLRKEIARLKEQGNEKILVPLQKLLEDLTRAMEKKPEQERT